MTNIVNATPTLAIEHVLLAGLPVRPRVPKLTASIPRQRPLFQRYESLMKQAQAMQPKMAEATAAVETLEVQDQTVGGLVTVALTAEGGMSGNAAFRRNASINPSSPRRRGYR